MLLPSNHRKVRGGGDVLAKGQYIIYIVYIQVKKGSLRKNDACGTWRGGCVCICTRPHCTATPASTQHTSISALLRACTSTAALYDPVSGSGPERS